MPPFPSPPITAFTSFILATTFTSPTAAAAYTCPFSSVISRKARVDDKFETVAPGVCFKT